MKPLSDMDRRVIALHQSGVSINDIVTETGLKRPRVKIIVDCLGPWHAKGEAQLAADPESLEGLKRTGAISAKTYSALANATYHFDVPDLQRVSDVAAQGRDCIARLDRIGPATMAEIDALLLRFGIAWNPRPRPTARRTSENQHPLLKSWERDAERSKQQETSSQFWHNIVLRVGEIERAVGTAVLETHPDRDGIEGISSRLAFLTGYLDGHFERRRDRDEQDVTPESADQDDGEYETAGDLICLPGVSLTSVLWTDDTDDPGPSAA